LRGKGEKEKKKKEKKILHPTGSVPGLGRRGTPKGGRKKKERERAEKESPCGVQLTYPLSS